MQGEMRGQGSTRKSPWPGKEYWQEHREDWFLLTYGEDDLVPDPDMEYWRAHKEEIDRLPSRQSMELTNRIRRSFKIDNIQEMSVEEILSLPEEMLEQPEDWEEKLEWIKAKLAEQEKERSRRLSGR